MSVSPRLLLPVATLADQLRAACILECTARKPGNVTPQHSFIDISYADFITSAEVSAPILAQSAERGVGQSIFAAGQATRNAVGSNTNLGMLLLLAPLAAIPTGVKCRAGIQHVLDALDLVETCWIYDAIRQAHPGGLGTAAEHDVAHTPTVSIVTAMASAPQDRIAWQYTHSYEDVLGKGRKLFLNFIGAGLDWETALIRVHLEFLAAQSDSLILRKCGNAIAVIAQQRAQDVLRKWPIGTPAPVDLKQFDNWLREEGHRRNPGTTADLLAAMLFALLRDQEWIPPSFVATL